jgi:nicotinate-nucleotide adenylyltransferase
VNTSHPAQGKRVCLFGGTFDPIHCAHLAIAKAAAARYSLNRILFVPAARPPHKLNLPVTPYEDRFRMVQLACAEHASFEPSRLEEGRAKSFSIDTVERFKPTLGPQDSLHFLIGADAFDEIETWHRWQDLVREVDFIVVSRPGSEFRVPTGARVCRLDNVALPVSSTSIRERVARGEPTPELLPAVRAYIDGHHLYRTPDSAVS